MSTEANPLDRIAGPVSLRILACLAGFWRAAQSLEAIARNDTDAAKALTESAKAAAKVFFEANPERDTQPVAWLDASQPIRERMEAACDRLLDMLRHEPGEVLRRCDKRAIVVGGQVLGMRFTGIDVTIGPRIEGPATAFIPGLAPDPNPPGTPLTVTRMDADAGTITLDGEKTP